MSKLLHPSNLGEYIDLSEETRLLESTPPNNKSSIEDSILNNLKHLQLNEINHEENKREIEEECRIEEKAAADIQWFDEKNTVHYGELTIWKRLNDRYKGEIKCDVPHGHGLYTFDGGLSYYKGEFEFGKYNGFGILHEHSGSHYVGGWHKNLRSNFGKQIYANGDIYEGNWNEDLYNEYGTCYWKNGAFYRGSIAKGKKNGNGIYKFADGTVYDGTWILNLRKKGVIYYPNGCRLEGEFYADHLSKSKFFDPNGACFDGLREDIYNRYLKDIDWHFTIDSDSQIKEKKMIETVEEKKRIEIKVEKKRIETEDEKEMLIKKPHLKINWHYLFQCFRSKNEKLD